MSPRTSKRPRPRPSLAARLGLALAAPLLVLGVAEGILRWAGFGYPTDYLVPALIEGEVRLVDNPHFGRRFFPPGMLRQPPPTAVTPEKAPGTVRVLLFGESAAMGDPQPAFGVARYLEVLLRERYPAGRFEVIPLAMTAVNSHALLPIARQATRLQADAWVIFAGNNEMLGPFGAGTALGRQAPPALLVRATLAVKATRFGQALETLFQRLRGDDGAGATRWEGLRLFTDQSVPEDSPERRRVYANFERNLRDIARLGRRSGARVVLASAAVNLRDCAPFGSSFPLPSPDTQAPPATERERLFRAGRDHLTAGDAPAALTALSQAETIAPTDAHLLFLLAQADLALSHTTEAAARFARARDLDTIPLRTDSKLVAVTQAVARQTDAVWCDASAALAAAAPQGIPGREFFYEHVHLTPLGNHALALAFAEALAPGLPADATREARPAWASAERCDERLALSPWNRHDAGELMLRRCTQPPFTGQINHDDHLRHLSQLVDHWRRQETPAAAAVARAAYTRALAEAPRDPHLRRSYAEFLDATGHLDEAIAEWRQLTTLLPRHFRGWYQAGADLLRAGRPADALPLLREVLVLQPEWPQAHVELGRALFQTRDAAGALAAYDHALRLDPTLAAARRHRADALAALGRRPEGLVDLEEAVRLDPRDAEARYLLGVEYAVLNRIAEAETQFTEVTRLQPDNVRAYFNLGVALARLTRWPEAVAAFETTLRLDPDHAEAATMLAQIRALRRPKPPAPTPSPAAPPPPQ